MPLTFNPANSEARDYALEIFGCGAGFFSVRETHDVPVELAGIFIRVKNVAAIPEHARLLSSALTSVGIDHEIVQRDLPLGSVTMPDHYCELVIGRMKQTSST